MMYIIDKQTGDVVWEGTHNYKGGMAHSHEPEMIEKGIPGAGNIILFDNSLAPRHRTHSRGGEGRGAAPEGARVPALHRARHG